MASERSLDNIMSVSCSKLASSPYFTFSVIDIFSMKSLDYLVRTLNGVMLLKS